MAARRRSKSQQNEYSKILPDNKNTSFALSNNEIIRTRSIKDKILLINKEIDEVDYIINNTILNSNEL